MLEQINNDPSFQHNFSSLLIPDALQIPKTQFLSAELKGSRYNVGSGPILVLDRRTIKVFGFTFEGDKAPGKEKRSVIEWKRSG